MSDISIKFVEFWPSFDPHHNPLTDALQLRHNVRVIDSDAAETPDILFYSCSRARRKPGISHYDHHNCLKVYFTGENDVPDFNECDYAMSFHPISFGPRHLRFPLYLFYEYRQALNPPEIADSEALRRGFCSMVLRNHNDCDPMRIKIIDAVEAYRPLAYGGRFRNNTGGCVDDKIDFLRHYKFNLALENSMVPGYVTEKIVEPLAAPTVPIYWGSDMAKTDFNPDAFINAADYDSLDSLVRRIEFLDNNDDDYLAMLRAPRLKSDPDFMSRLVDFLDYIAATQRRFVIPYAESALRQRRNRLMVPIYSSRLFRLLAKSASLKTRRRRF